MEQLTDVQLTIPDVDFDDYLTLEGLASRNRNLGIERDQHLEEVALIHAARVAIRTKKHELENPDHFRPTDEVREP